MAGSGLVSDSDAASIAALFDTGFEGLRAMGVLQSVTLSTFASEGSATDFGEKQSSFTTSTIDAAVLHFSLNQKIKAEGLIDDKDIRIMTKSAITSKDRVTISGLTYYVVNIVKRVIKTTSIYDCQVRRID